MSDYNISVLSNGLRMIHSRIDGNVSYAGIAVGAGSRDEPSHAEGLAHFVEHTIFKGTTSRKSWHISNRMESIGGELNAYTSKEETVIFTNAPAGYESRAFELISDIIGRSVFPEKEIDKEREVIVEEINSYLDSPAEAVIDQFEDRIYKGSPLGHNILGSPESVRAIQSSDCRKFLDEFYTPDNMVLYCSDSLSHSKAHILAEKYFSYLHLSKKDSIRAVPHVPKPFREVIEQNGHQAHTIIGTRIFGRNDPNRFAIFLLNNYLGGPCMNSRLNQQLREKRGYVYSVDSMVGLLSDCGSLMIYLGSDPEKVDKCVKIVFEEIEKLAEKTMNPRVFERIKRQYAGQLLVSSDNRENISISLGKNLLYYNQIHDVRTTTRFIEQVTPDDFRSAAELILPEKMSVLTLC